MDGYERKESYKLNCNSLIFSEPAGIQTPSLLIRSQMLYSVKLQARIKMFLVLPSEFWEVQM